jgi:hypothetical protein
MDTEWYKWVFSGAGATAIYILVDMRKNLFLKRLLNVMVLKRHNYLLSKGTGFIFNSYTATFTLYPNGDSTSETQIEIEAVSSEVASRDHKIYTSGDGCFKDTDIDVSGESDDTLISKRIVKQDDNSINLEILFSPALKKHGKATYRIVRRSKKGLYAMTRQEIMEHIRNEKHSEYGPYEYSRCIVRYPTDKLRMVVNFPKDFDISGEQFFDVFTGQSWDRANGEVARIKKNQYIKKTFDQKEHTNKIELNIEYPFVGLSYAIKWIPPETGGRES